MRAGLSKSKSKTTQTLKSTSEIERVKLDLLSLVSHELRTPLTSVLNSLRVLRDEDVTGAERQKFLDMAYRNAERLNSTLNELLDLSKLVSGRLVCRFHEVNLKHLLTSQLEALRSDANLLGFTLTAPALSKALDDLPVVLGDAPRLDQVFKSVFENALKFSPSAAKITVRLKASREALALDVVNPIKEGVRINQKELFKIFSQQEDILNRAHEGVGGSLAIAAEVVRQHGGAMNATIADGKFAISVTLPVLESEDALIKVLESRMFALRTELGAISLVILEVGPKSVKPVLEALKAALFRASDSVYSLPKQNQVAVLMDDCKKSDAPKIIRRLLANVGTEHAKLLKAGSVGFSSCPEDATDPVKLLSQARSSAVKISEF